MDLRRPSQPRRPWFDLTPLRHPLFWVALGVLLVNDNLLKGRGVVPSWLTGKLSDFAFLIVAPIVFAALLPVRMPARRSVATLCIAGLFVATDLSAAISDSVVAVAARLGMTWRLWPDPTDLIALSVLPFTVRVLRGQATAAPRERGLKLRERVGLLVGAVACLATSAPPRHLHHPFFVNRSPKTADVTVTWLLRKVDCDARPETLAKSIMPGDLDDPRMLSVATGEVAVLDGPPTPGQSPVGNCDLEGDQGTGDCVAAILETSNAHAVLMMAYASWYESDSGDFFSCSRPSPRVSRCGSHFGTSADPGPDAISLVRSGAQLVFQGRHDTASQVDAGAYDEKRPKVRIADIDPSAIATLSGAANDCRSLRDSIRALRTATSCSVDEDCQSLEIPPLPGDPVPTSCNAYLNRTVSPRDVQALVTKWRANCATQDGGCTLLQPASCSSGYCQPLCPGQVLQECPPPCLSLGSGPGDAGEHCTLDEECLEDAHSACWCDRGVRNCLRYDPAPGCRLECTPRDAGTTSSTHRTDGGVDEDAGSTSGP